jgi:tetratricopeptide (TPR) repeat protein
MCPNFVVKKINYQNSKFTAMKKFVSTMLCIALASFSFGQLKTHGVSGKTGIIEGIEPVFADLNSVNDKNDLNGSCNSAIGNYLRNNIKYPESAINCCKQGTEIVRFTVMPNGKLENIEVVNCVCPKIDEEMIRVLKTTNGMWTPGTKNGLPVEMEKEILVVFHLEGFHLGTDEEYFTKKAINWYKKGNQALFEQKNPEKALKCYNNAIKYRPLEDALLFARGMAKYELNDFTRAKEDWKRMKSLVARNENESNLTLVAENFKDLRGYIEFGKY